MKTSNTTNATRGHRLLKRLAATLTASLTVALVLAPAANATFADHSGLIAFQAEIDGNIQLFTLRPNGHDIRQITNVDGSAAVPDWSPDGRMLTFTFNECSVGFVDADGGNLRILPPAPGEGTPGVDVCEGDSSFTPDGERVVFGHYSFALDKEDIRTMRLDGTDRRVITELGGPDPNVSPDGLKVSFKAHPVGALFVANIDGSDPVQVSPSVSVAYKSDWAPDGEHLVYSDNSEPGPLETVNIATVRPDGTDRHYITHFTDPGQYAYVGSYSPNGHWIDFRLRDGNVFALYRVRPDGTGLHQITPFSTFLPRNIDWGPAVH